MESSSWNSYPGRMCLWSPAAGVSKGLHGNVGKAWKLEPVVATANHHCQEEELLQEYPRGGIASGQDGVLP